MLPTSPGSEKGGCTGLRVTLPVPHEPTQKDETSDISSQKPLYGTSLYHLTLVTCQDKCLDGMANTYISSTHHETPLEDIQSGKTVYPGHTAPRY